MQIADLKIQKFRGIHNALVRFDSHTVLIGANNCGKSTVIEALTFLFGRDRLIRDMTEHDFFGSNPTAGDRISLIATLTDFPENDPDRNRDWFREERAVEKWLDPATGVLHADATDGRKLACQIGVAARFEAETLEVEFVRYFHDDDDTGDVFDSQAVIRRVPAQLVREVGFFLVPANRTWDRTMSFGSELFRRVVSSMGGQPAAAVLTERDRLRTPSPALEADTGLAPIVASVEDELAGILGKHVGLKLRLTGTDSDAVLDAVIPHYIVEATHQIPARRQGSGLVSLQHALLLLHFGRVRASENKSFIMAIEEPELHVPPPLQRRLVHRLRSLSTQTIVVTHSPLVASVCDPTSIRVLRNESGEMQARPFAAATLARSDPNWKRILYATKRQDTLAALMHEAVLVPEGRTDFDLLNLMVNADEIRRPAHVAASTGADFGMRVGVVPTQDGNIKGVFGELTKVHNKVMCIVDGDSEGDAYVGALTVLMQPPRRILQLLANWTVEDVIGWVAAADEAAVLTELSAQLGVTLARVTDLVSHMKLESKDGGFKADNVVYETIIGLVADSASCLSRLRTFLRRLSDAAIDLAAVPSGWSMTSASTARTIVVRFEP